jgi:hypothetical protein
MASEFSFAGREIHPLLSRKLHFHGLFRDQPFLADASKCGSGAGYWEPPIPHQRRGPTNVMNFTHPTGEEGPDYREQ